MQVPEEMKQTGEPSSHRTGECWEIICGRQVVVIHLIPSNLETDLQIRIKVFKPDILGADHLRFTTSQQESREKGVFEINR